MHMRERTWMAFYYYPSDVTFESASFGSGRIMNAAARDNSTYTYQYFITDHLGSTRMVVDGNGVPLEATEYYPYGTMVPVAPSANPEVPAREKFTGKEFDTEGEDVANGAPGIQCYYFGARYYDPEVGVWGSCDKAGQFASGYGYGTSPVIMVDEDGNFIWFAIGLGLMAWNAYSNYQTFSALGMSQGGALLATGAMVGLGLATGGIGDKIAGTLANKVVGGMAQGVAKAAIGGIVKGAVNGAISGAINGAASGTIAGAMYGTDVNDFMGIVGSNIVGQAGRGLAFGAASGLTMNTIGYGIEKSGLYKGNKFWNTNRTNTRGTSKDAANTYLNDKFERPLIETPGKVTAETPSLNQLQVLTPDVNLPVINRITPSTISFDGINGTFIFPDADATVINSFIVQSSGSQERIMNLMNLLMEF